MVKLNNPVDSYNGEMRIWMDGREIAHYGERFPTGYWWEDTYFFPSNNPDEPPGGNADGWGPFVNFEGFRWRKVPNLVMEHLWPQNYVAMPDPLGSAFNKEYSDVRWAHVVIARNYIGPLASPTAGGSYVLSASQDSVGPNELIAVDWSVPAGAGSTSDWIGLYRRGAEDGSYLDWRGTQGTDLGQATFTMPGTPGDYEFRYFGGQTRRAMSDPVTLRPYELVGSIDGGLVSVKWTAPAGWHLDEIHFLNLTTGVHELTLNTWGEAEGKIDYGWDVVGGHQYQFKWYLYGGRRVLNSNVMTAGAP
jgi:hypothetical protein